MIVESPTFPIRYSILHGYPNVFVLCPLPDFFATPLHCFDIVPPIFQMYALAVMLSVRILTWLLGTKTRLCRARKIALSSSTLMWSLHSSISHLPPASTFSEWAPQPSSEASVITVELGSPILMGFREFCIWRSHQRMCPWWEIDISLSKFPWQHVNALFLSISSDFIWPWP